MLSQLYIYIYLDLYSCCDFLQLTTKSGSWMPRLERMVKSRNLVQFEKNVLLSLIGFVIQPNKVIV